jgi:hypothetical protein
MRSWPAGPLWIVALRSEDMREPGRMPREAELLLSVEAMEGAMEVWRRLVMVGLVLVGD